MKKGILLLIFLVGFVLIGCNEDSKVNPKLNVTPTEMTLEIGEEQKIAATLTDAKKDAVVKYTSSDESIANVNTDGTVSAKKHGTATITVTVDGHSELKATVSITVNIDLESQLSVTGPTEVVAGEKIQLEAIDELDSGHGVMWQSETPNIAKVNSTGEVTGVSEGTAKIKVSSMENGNSKIYEVEVLMAVVESLSLSANVQGNKVKTSAKYRLTAKVFPAAAEQSIVWETSNDAIATIDENGNVNIADYGTVTFTARSTQEDTVVDEITVEFYWDVMDLIDYVMVTNPIIDLDAQGYGWEAGYNPYNTEVLGSVSNFYFGEYPEFTQIIPVGKANRPGIIKTSTEFITVHDTATGSPGGNGQMHSSLVQNFSSSWHYSIGNDGVFKQLPDEEVAYHAGDGSNLYKLIDTGIEAVSKVKPKQGIDAAGFYTLNGEKTSILAPKNGDTILTTAHINDYGIYMEVGSNGNWWMNDSWYSKDYRLIGNKGGNRNSIGIESSMNYGSDLYQTWHFLAKKSSRLALDHDLGLDRIVTHHFFSGKDCPMTLRKNGLFENFRLMIEAEYLVNKFLGNYTLSFISNNTDLVNHNGRVVKLPDVDTSVSFLVTIENSEIGFSQTKIYNSTIPARTN